MSSTDVCAVCKSRQAKYTCPTCQISYCSKECFKTHNIRCTEAFYKSHVMEELRGRQKQQALQSQQQVSAALEESLESPSELTEDEFQHLASLLSKESLEMDDLSPYEQSLFLQEIADSDFLKCIPEWVPWWTQTVDEHMRATPLPPDPDPPEEVLFETVFRPSVPCRARAPLGELPPQLEAVQTASPLLVYQILHMMTSYCFLIRQFHGDWSAEPSDFASSLAQLSPSLSSGKVFVSVTEVLRENGAKGFEAVVLPDLALLLDSPHYISDLVFDVYQCLGVCVADKTLPKSERKAFRSIQQKLHFYDSYCQVINSSRWRSLKQGIQAALETDFAPNPRL